MYDKKCNTGDLTFILICCWSSDLRIQVRNVIYITCYSLDYGILQQYIDIHIMYYTCICVVWCVCFCKHNITYYVRSSRQTRCLPIWKLVSCFVAFICNFFLVYFMFIFVYVHYFVFNWVLLYIDYNNNNDILYYYIYETKTWTNLCIYFSTDYILIKNYLFIYA